MGPINPLPAMLLVLRPQSFLLPVPLFTNWWVTVRPDDLEIVATPLPWNVPLLPSALTVAPNEPFWM